MKVFAKDDVTLKFDFPIFHYATSKIPTSN